jgi:hypothetical protein
MALNSRRPARRPITTAAIVMLTAAPLVSCGGGGNSCDIFCKLAGPPGHPAPSQHSSPPEQASAGGEQRLGCGTYCQDAAPLGGNVGPGQTSVTIVSNGTVTLDADGYLPVTVKCKLSMPCKGSLVATDYGFDGPAIGRSDLQVNTGATATLGIKLPEALATYIRSHSPQVLSVLADVGPSFGCDGKVYEGETHTGLPPCGREPVKGFSVMSTGHLNVIAAG